MLDFVANVAFAAALPCWWLLLTCVSGVAGALIQQWRHKTAATKVRSVGSQTTVLMVQGTVQESDAGTAPTVRQRRGALPRSVFVATSNRWQLKFHSTSACYGLRSACGVREHEVCELCDRRNTLIAGQ